MKKSETLQQILALVFLLWPVILIISLAYFYIQNLREDFFGKFKNISDCTNYIDKDYYTDYSGFGGILWKEIPEVCKPVHEEKKRRDQEREQKQFMESLKNNTEVVELFLEGK